MGRRKVKDMLYPRKFLMEKNIVEIMMTLTLPMKMMSSRSFWEFQGKPQRRNPRHPKKKEQHPRARKRKRRKRKELRSQQRQSQLLNQQAKNKYMIYNPGRN